MSNESDSCARRFGVEHADLPAAEMAALYDSSGFSVEGAFVDSYAKTSGAAVAAVKKIYAKRGVRAEDIARLTEVLRHEGRYPNDETEVLAAAGKKIVPALREAVGHPLPLVRIRAARTLGRLRCGRDAIGLIHDPETAVRLAALECGATGGRAWLAAVEAQLQAEPHARVRIEMVRRLAKIGTTAALRMVMRSRFDTDGDVRTAAAESLEDVSWKGRVSPRTVARLACEWLVDEYEVGVCVQLLRFAPLLPYEPRALPALSAMLDDPVLGPHAAACLAKADEKQAPAAASALAARARGTENRFQIAVFRAMVKLGDRRAVRLFEEPMLGWIGVRARYGYLLEELEELKRTGRDIPEPGKLPAGELPTVMDPGVRGVAPPSAADRVAYLQLTIGTETERYEATKYKPRLDRMGWWAGALLERLREEESASLREAILGALGKLDAPESAEAHIVALNDASARVRICAARYLAYHGGLEASRAILARLPVETDDVVRRSMLDKKWLLARLPEGKETIRPLLDDPDPGIRERAEEILRNAG